MPVTVEVVGSETQTCVVADDATYADLIRTAGYPPQETTILVDGTPVPGDATVDTNRVRLLRLIQGGGDTEVRKQISTNARTDTTESLPTGVSIEPATPADRLDIVRVLDAAMLQTDVSALAERIAVDAVICARFERTGAVVGAVVVTAAGHRHGSHRRARGASRPPWERYRIGARRLRGRCCER